MKKQKPLDEIKAEILKDQEEESPVNERPVNVEMLETPSRRGFLKTVGISAVLLALGGQFYAMLRSLFPNVLYEPPQKFKVGTLDKFTDGGTFLEDKRLFVFRQQNIFHAISASCTHLGCTPRWLAAENKFKCPCHGSGFFKSGLNFEGPAPRPLDRFQVTVGDDGQLVVDKSKVFKMNPGAEPDEQYAESVLKV